MMKEHRTTIIVDNIYDSHSADQGAGEKLEVMFSEIAEQAEANKDAGKLSKITFHVTVEAIDPVPVPA
jgi:hypothetical protein